MKVLRFTILSLTSLTLIISSLAYAAGGWVITLTNGETLSANDCDVEDGRLHIFYPVGDACIPVGSVASAIRDGAPVELLQSEGEQLSHAREISPAPHEKIAPVATAMSPRTPLKSTPADDQSSAAPPDHGYGPGQMRIHRIMSQRDRQASVPGAAGVIDSSKRWPYGQSYDAYELVSQAEYIDDDELNRRLDKLFPEFDVDTDPDVQ